MAAGRLRSNNFRIADVPGFRHRYRLAPTFETFAAINQPVESGRTFMFRDVSWAASRQAGFRPLYRRSCLFPAVRAVNRFRPNLCRPECPARSAIEQRHPKPLFDFDDMPAKGPRFDIHAARPG